MLRQMTPDFPPDDVTDGRCADPVFSRKASMSHAASRVASANLAYERLSKPCKVIVFAISRRIACPPLRFHVCLVVGLCAQEQVVRIDAGRIVATMARSHSRWNRTVRHLPGEAMRKACHCFLAIPNTKDPVSMRGAPRRPQPTRVARRSLHFRPKPFRIGDFPGICAAPMATESLGHELRREGRATVLTGILIRHRHLPGDGAMPAGVVSTAPAPLCLNYSTEGRAHG
jgi:hypothetical protein